MPNYCENHVRVVNWDTPYRVDDFIKFIKGENGDFDFNKAISYPEAWATADKAFQEYIEKHGWKGAPKDGYNQGGYDWCKENWGTKWNAGKIEVERIREEIVQYQFDTAWSPPLPVMDKLAELFSDCEIYLEYYERGMAFCGSICWENGKRKYEAQGEYHGWRGG